jgi:pyridoxamine 5'-phosphate oxidase
MSKAVAQAIPEPTAMSLATVGKSGAPTVRAVLFKGMVRGGFSFYTNYNSPKAQELIENPQASLLFFWPTLQQQIRICGDVQKLTRKESEEYFKTRPRISQIGAWASDQSQEIPSIDFLNNKASELEKKYHGQEIPCPPHWGGFHCSSYQFI